MKKHSVCTLLTIVSFGTTTGYCHAYSENERHWPYQQIPVTTFGKVIGPNAADASFVINGRPISFTKADRRLPLIQKQIAATLKEAEAMAKSNGRPVTVSTEPIQYLKNVKQTLAALCNPSLKMTASRDYVSVIYTPPYEHLGDNDIVLYDALASICARQQEFPDSYKNMLKSLERKKEIYGAQSDEVAQQLIDIAALNEDVHNYNASERAYRQAYETIKGIHGESSKESAAVLMQLSHNLASAGRKAESQATGQQALGVMNRLGIRNAGYGLPLSCSHSWQDVAPDITSIISAVEQDNARRKADVDAMKQSLHSMIHEEEIARRRAQEALNKAAREALQQKIIEENEKLLGKNPNVSGIRFYNRATDTAGSLKFMNDGTVEIVPEYLRLDGVTQPPAKQGTWKIDDDSDNPEKPDPIVRVVSTADQRIDKWHINVSNQILGEIYLDALEPKKPYPSYLKGQAKIKIPPEVQTEIDNFKFVPTNSGPEKAARALY
jgi:hypothetical protein